jgi:transcriptional regulator with XRE-family HTH domain
MSDLGNKAIMAENIQRLMDSRGIDRNKICSDLGFKYTTFTDWVKGNTYPRIDKIEMMANYFGVPKSELVEKHVEGGYYTDREAAEFAEYLRTRPGARMLFSAAKDISKEEMEETVKYIEFLKSKHK